MKKGIPVTARWFTALFIAVITGTIGQSAMAMEIHTWTDESGVTHYTDTQSAAADSRTIEIHDPRQAEAPPPAAHPPDSLPGNSQETPQTAAQRIRGDIASRRMALHEARELTEPICGKHRNRLEQMLPARRVYYQDENGQEVRMDDTERVALIEESKNYLAENCN